MSTHSSVLAWRIPGTKEPSGLLSKGSRRVGHNCKKINIEELGKAFENNPYKFLKDTANHNNVMSTVATSVSCDHLKGKSNVLVIQKPGFNCKSFPDPVNCNSNSHTTIHNESDQPKSLEIIANRELKEGSTLQPSLLSLMKDRRLTLEQVVATLRRQPCG